MKVIIGLGNPGNKYDETRHNIGFKIVDSFANRYLFPAFKKDFHALISSTQYIIKIFQDRKYRKR